METPASTPDPARMAPPHDALLAEPFDTVAIAARVAIHRGVELRRPVKFAGWDEAVLFHKLDPANEPATGAILAPFLRDFGLAQPGDSMTKLPALYEKGLSGLYDARTKRIRLQSHSGETEQKRLWTLVHEIEHALQDQSSKLSRRPESDDEALALRAVIEGDAEITTAAFLASRHLSLDHWLAQLLAYARDTSSHTAAFAGAPDFVRRQWLFPYIDGTLLVGSLYRAGGYELVDRMFEHPPISTEQVLHPEKYLAGEMPVRVPIPVAPEGYTVIAKGEMGELRAQGLVAPCDGAHAEDPSPAWGGDAYALVTDGGTSRAVLWNTVWDDEESARRFDASLRAGEACIRKRLGEGFAQQDATVVSNEVRVAYVRGLPAERAEVTARALLSVPVERPAGDGPLGDVRLRPIADPRSFVGKGALRAGRYVSEPLGLSLSVQGFDAIQTTLFDELTLEEYFGLTNVDLTVTALLTSWTPELEERVAWDFVGPLEDAGLPVVYLGESAVVTGAGPGRALRWSRGYGTNAVAIFVPVCGGKITIAIRAGGGGSGVWSEIQRVARRLRFDVTSPACRFVTEDTPAAALER